MPNRKKIVKELPVTHLKPGKICREGVMNQDGVLLAGKHTKVSCNIIDLLWENSRHRQIKAPIRVLTDA